MADAPTLASITIEALERLGKKTPATNHAALLARAQDEWLEEVKVDIYTALKKPVMLQALKVLVLTKGKQRYSLPTDFARVEVMRLLHGATEGTAQAGIASKLTLAADDATAEETMIGKEILITDGAAKGSFSQVTAYNTTTKEATPTPNFNAAPGAAGYMIVTNHLPLFPTTLDIYNQEQTPTAKNRPTHYVVKGDANDKEITLFPTPDRVYGLEMPYYTDLLELAASTRLNTLFKRWRNVFLYGVMAKGAEDQGNNKAQEYDGKYMRALGLLKTKEEYGQDVDDIRCYVSDYA